jgi:hypothetical protein
MNASEAAPNMVEQWRSGWQTQPSEGWNIVQEQQLPRGIVEKKGIGER